MKQEKKIPNIELEILVKNRTIELQKVNEKLKNEIKKHKKTEESFKESESKYRRLIENIPDIVWTLDSDKKVKFVSQKVEEKYGISPEEIYKGGDSFWIERNHPDDGIKFNNAFDLLLSEGKALDIEYRFRDRHSEWIWIHDRAISTYKKDGVIYVDGISTDITRKKQLDELFQKQNESLKESEERYRNMFHSNHSVMLIIDPENADIVDANPAALSFYGYSYKELTSKKIIEINLLSKDKFSEKIAEINLEQHRHSISRHKLCSGELREVEVFSGPIIINKKIYICPIIHDITDRVKAEEKILNLLDEIGEAKLTADTANQTKSTFLANMSHELRTPLNAILGFSQLLELEQDHLNNRQIEFLEHIKHSSNHLLEMVNDILDLSKIEAGRFGIDKKPFHLGQMLLRLPKAVTSLALNKDIKLKIDINLGDELIQADEVRLKQVLYNLLSNAIKFTDSGKKIGIKASVMDNEAIIEVWDEGRGINNKDLNRVFDPFEQVGQAKPQGTGLGLAISRKLIELHEGTLAAYSRIGEGSRFVIRMPGIIRQSSSGMQKKKVKSEAQKKAIGTRGNILIIEDNIIHQKVLESTLLHLGYNSQSERTGQRGIDALLKKDFDLILMDIQLPGMDGVETMKFIHMDGKKSVPIVALTAYAMKGDLEKFRSEGFDGYISKPIVINRLKATLETLLN